MGRRLRKNRDQFLHLSKAHIPNICLCQIKPSLSKNPPFYQTSFSYMFLCHIQSIEKSFNLFRNASSPPYIHISLLLPFQTTLTGFGWNLLDSRKLFLSLSDFWVLPLRRSIHQPFGLIGSCRDLFIPFPTRPPPSSPAVFAV